MKTFIQNLQDSLVKDLQKNEAENDNHLIIAQEAAKLYNTGMLKLKEFLSTYKFKNIEEEIHLFKELKPSINKHLIYYTKLCDIESRRPIGSTQIVKQYLIDELNHLKRFFDKNAAFYQYVRLERTDFDHKYFLRRENSIIDDLTCEKDPNFSTPCDFKIAKIEANKNLISYLNIEIEKLENSNTNFTVFQNSLKWTGNKVWLIELAYSLYSIGVVNDGNANIKEIVKGFERMYNINLENCYGSFSDIRRRKVNPTTFLDKLKEKVQQKINEPFERF